MVLVVVEEVEEVRLLVQLQQVMELGVVSTAVVEEVEVILEQVRAQGQ
jgi:hypothetical protein